MSKSIKKANFYCSKCFEYHQDIEVTRLDSALKDYSHYSECPIKKQVVLINLKDIGNDKRF
mgnify:CR=1 FL=1